LPYNLIHFNDSAWYLLSLFHFKTGLLNVMCGYETQDLPDAEAAKRIWTSGCISSVEYLLYGNLYIIAGVATGVAFAQLFVIFLSRTLEGQIQRQKSLWMH